MSALYGETSAMPCACRRRDGRRKSIDFNVCEVEILEGFGGGLFWAHW